MSDQHQFHPKCGIVHDPRVSCPADREHWIGDGCLPPHETLGEAASPDPALERIREQNRTLHASADYEWVNHPPHYNSHPAGIECIDVVEHLTFNVGTAIKHAWRTGLKPGADAVQDLRKSIWYLEREIKRLGASGEH